jgi:hypothetical protein
MRRRAPQLFAVAAVAFLAFAGAQAQVLTRPTPEPLVTAENERWYLEGEAIVGAGDLYFPTGPLMFFRPFEMVRSGDYRGIPLYARTTLEPYSLLYVPVGGGLMRPYERRRAGDLVGTTGSTAPSLPGDARAVESLVGGIFQAPGPPVLGPDIQGVPIGDAALRHAAGEPQPAATAGAEPSPPPGPLATARKPEGLDAIFVEYRDRRWLLSGSPVTLDPAAFTRIGDHAGFAVYRRSDDERTIYVALSTDGRGVLVPYSAKP